MLVYILIFGLAVICSVLLLWYFDPLERDPLKEGFQARTYNKQSPVEYSGVGGATQVSGTLAQVQAACDTAPGCVGFLYYGDMAYLNTGATMKTAPTGGPAYDSGTNDLTFTLPNKNSVQTVVVNAIRRYIRIGVSKTTPDKYAGLDQVVVLDNNGNNAALGKKCTATGKYDAYTLPNEKVIDGTTTGRKYPDVWYSSSNMSDYWELDLGVPTKIASIIIYSPTDNLNDRIIGMPITVSVNPGGVAYSDWDRLGIDPSKGIFMLAGSGIDQTITPNYSGRYVRIRPILYWGWGDGNISISSVIVTDQAGNNVSIGKPTYSTSMWPGTEPVRQIVDGKTTPSNGTAFSSGDRTDFIEIDLGSVVNISTIRILGGSDCCFPGQSSYVSDRQKGLRVIVSPTSTSEAMAAYAATAVYKVYVPPPVVPPPAPVVQPPAPQAPVTPITGSFWDLVNKIDTQQDPAAIATLARVSDPNPNDPSDLMPLSFSKYISIYAMSQHSDPVAARKALFNNYNTLQSGLSKNVYTAPPEGTDIKARSCANLDAARNTYNAKYNEVVAAAQDLSGTAIKAGIMREENLAYQNANLAACKGTNPSPACISLASQEAPVFSLLSKYTNVNNIFASSGAIDISNNLDIINNAYTILGCSGTPLKFSQDLANSIDTQLLVSKLNQMSPYYLSPDTLQYITSSIISGPETDASLMSDADTLSNISNVITNIKIMTGAS